MTHTCPTVATPQAAHAPYPGAVAADGPEVLFVCTRGAGRSPMGAALLSQHSHGRIQAHSAGTSPAPWTAPAVVTAMAELGIDLSAHRPIRLTDDAVRSASVVITMGCGDAVPQYPHARYLTWEVDDPAERPLEEVRSIRDEIDTRVRALLYSLGVAARVGLLRGGTPDPGLTDPDRSAAGPPAGGCPATDGSGGTGLVAGGRIVGDALTPRASAPPIGPPLIGAPAAGQVLRGPAVFGHGSWPRRLSVPPPRTRAYLGRAPQTGPALHG
ncbi:hypothetical protein [Frankia sp. R82]|uniref:arsenate-mycothiol transferase ArsC n=1 Tax=Frankia sp. R82 TaxID=2950553 RepID=UPI0027E24D0C|nr:hypothetical protein [Frankia sp. R82]